MTSLLCGCIFLRKMLRPYDRVLKGFRGEVVKEEPLCRHTSYRIGGPADLYLVPADEEDLKGLLGRAREAGVPTFILGNGSKLLVHDEGVRGVVVDVRMVSDRIVLKDDEVSVGAGTELDLLAAWTVGEGLEGFAELSGIPGTVGGAIAMNSGAFGRTISELLTEVRALTPDGREVVLSKDEIGFGYRKGLEGFVVLSAKFRPERKDPELLWEKRREVLKLRSEKQPLEHPSAGSVFKRPPGDYAGRLIEEAGCKGMRVGDAMVSPKHANFVVNLGRAKASEVWALICEVRRRVEEKFSVDLELEVRLWGFRGLSTRGSQR